MKPGSSHQPPRISSLCRNVIAGHLGGVSNQQPSVGYGGVVPASPLERGESGNLIKFLGSCFHQYQLARVAQYDQVSAGQEHLPVSESPILPFLFASPDINTGQDAFVQSVG